MRFGRVDIYIYIYRILERIISFSLIEEFYQYKFDQDKVNVNPDFATSLMPRHFVHSTYKRGSGEIQVI